MHACKCCAVTPMQPPLPLLCQGMARSNPMYPALSRMWSSAHGPYRKRLSVKP